MSKPRKKSKKILFILEIVVLLLFIGGLFVYGQISAKLDKIDIQETDLADQDIVTNDQAPQMTGYTTYALFGLDHRSKNEKLNTENSDTIIIASINNDTKAVKLVSVYRDTLLNVKDDTYSKANSAYALGGPTNAVSMLNTNLDLNITDYVAIDFNALVTVVDCLGGLDIPLSYAEIVHMNNYCVETSEETGKSYTPVELPDPKPEDEEAIVDTYHLNGVQATSYCRIRYTASLDMGRTERQRRVIQMIVDKAKKAGLSTIFDIMDQVFPMVKTSVSKTEILKMIPAMIGYSIDETTGFPNDYKFAQVKGSVIVPTTLESNVLKIHQFLYGDASYTPTQDVLNRSAQITNIAGGGDVQDTAPAVTDTPNDTTDDSYTWQGDTSTDYSSTDTSGDADYSADTDYDADYSGGDYSTDTDYSGDNSDTDTDDYDTDYSDYTDGEDYSENE
ncbi:LCP family protein [Blautia massiliensis]|jgi:polyisoprenyl-teichoic acid--peptidoglycan teichoic acid transferase|uniref:LCP family protein n=1 Tax=Blautia TaxID=572511 RepID=UPI00156F231D|nr:MULTISPECIES: LCP family protein [Blautia]MCC2726278.1 LCP family protein [Blautia sp. MSK22_86]NSF57324.1 LCP family protein [Blautia massiliensis (ex Durand et al. 2017)]NSK72669.1 LCP family protein [Blautia massiliensis (ex Durand et al. 2017)]